MAEYIEREAVMPAIDDSAELYPSEYDEIRRHINAIPAADVEPVVHGKINYRNRPEHYLSYKLSGLTEGGDLLYKREHRILRNNPVGYCSECGKRLCSRFTSYCPSCGAKMQEAR